MQPKPKTDLLPRQALDTHADENMNDVCPAVAALHELSNKLQKTDVTGPDADYGEQTGVFCFLTKEEIVSNELTETRSGSFCLALALPRHAEDLLIMR